MLSVLLVEEPRVKLAQEALEVSLKVVNLEELAHAQDLAQNELELFFGGTLEGFNQLCRDTIQIDSGLISIPPDDIDVLLHEMIYLLMRRVIFRAQIWSGLSLARKSCHFMPCLKRIVDGLRVETADFLNDCPRKDIV